MGTPFIGELRLVAFNFAPKGWAVADGQMMQIAQNQALFSLFGTTYGGDGRTTFALPNLQGRVAMHVGAGFTQGQAGGETAHTLVFGEMPPHNHVVQGTQDQGTTPVPGGNVFANANANAYAKPGSQPLVQASISSVGGQAHENMAPYTVLTYVVALQGIFPSRN